MTDSIVLRNCRLCLLRRQELFPVQMGRKVMAAQRLVRLAQGLAGNKVTTHLYPAWCERTLH